MRVGRWNGLRPQPSSWICCAACDGYRCGLCYSLRPYSYLTLLISVYSTIKRMMPAAAAAAAAAGTPPIHTYFPAHFLRL